MEVSHTGLHLVTGFCAAALHGWDWKGREKEGQGELGFMICAVKWRSSPIAGRAASPEWKCHDILMALECSRYEGMKHSCSTRKCVLRTDYAMFHECCFLMFPLNFRFRVCYDPALQNCSAMEETEAPANPDMFGLGVCNSDKQSWE